MDKLPAIPTPVSVYWREARYRFLPLIVFGLVLAACFLLYRQVAQRGHVAGLGEGVRSLIASPQLILIQEMKVKPYQWVAAGEPIMTVRPIDLNANLDFLRFELGVARLRMEPSMADQNAVRYERLRADTLRLKQDLAAAKVNLQRAENVVRRTTPLYEAGYTSEDEYDLNLMNRDLYEAEVEEIGQALVEMEGHLTSLRPLGEPEMPGTNHPLMELTSSLQTRMQQAQTNWAPYTMRAPISGMVYMVYRQQGEYVREGDALVSIYAARSDRVVAYLRQPYPIEPKVGWKVQVATQTRPSLTFFGEINQIGAQLEVITNAFAYVRQGALVDVGLPIVINVPEEINIRPGEMVDIKFLPHSKQGLPLPGNQPQDSLLSRLR